LSDATKAQIDRGFFAWKLAIAEGDEAAIGAANEVMRKSGRASMIIDRDVWMAAKLVQVCAHISETLKQASVDEQCSMVALVGAGHVSGMTELLTKMNGQSCEQQMMDLLTSDEYVELLDDSEREHLVNTLFYVPEPVQ
jgi:pheromone shutdown protein TraB